MHSNQKCVPLTRQLKPQAVSILVDAFMTDPLFSFLMPNERQRRRWLPHLWKSIANYSVAQEQSRVAVDDKGRVLGACIAGPYPPSAWQEFMLNLSVTLRPWPWEPALRPMLRISTYSKLWKQMHWQEPHWYVYVIGVSPEHQRKGIGRALMLDLIDRGNAERTPIYLETQTESNVPFYRGLGFDVTEHHRPFANGPGTWGMFRRCDVK